MSQKATEIPELVRREMKFRNFDFIVNGYSHNSVKIKERWKVGVPGCHINDI